MYWFCLQDVLLRQPIADVRRFVWLGAVKLTLVGSHLKETVLKNFFRDSTSIFFQTMAIAVKE